MAWDPGPLPDFPLMAALTAPLRAAGDAAGSTDFQFLLYGQSAALNRELPAADLVGLLVRETGSVLAMLAAGK